MGLFTRVADIVSANLNEMIEKFEDPEKMLKQAVRDMESAIEQAQRSAAQAGARLKLAQREQQKNRQEAQTWRGRAQTAVADGNDDLARRALLRKREHEQILNALDDQIEAERQISQSLRTQLAAMQAKLAEAKRRLATLTARQRVANLRTKVAAAPAEVGLDDKAFAKFDRMRGKVELAEAEAEALRELAGDPDIDMSLYAEPATDPSNGSAYDVDDELAKLKAGLRRDS